MQQGFVFVNPQATKSCGCGTSFSAYACVAGHFIGGVGVHPHELPNLPDNFEVDPAALRLDYVRNAA
jgi:hypothetical protein